MAPSVGALAFAALLPALAHACTMVVVGPQATVDGAALVLHTDDAGPAATDLRLVRVPAQSHPPGARRPVYPVAPGGYPRVVTTHRGPAYMPRPEQPLTPPLGYIPEVPHTHGYWDTSYGLLNDAGLAMGESTCMARTTGWPLNLPYGRNLFSVGELGRVALERCTTARCAVDLMGALAERYGFYGDDVGTPDQPQDIGAGEALGLADAAGEVWVFHVLTGPGNASAVWAAQRVGAAEVSVVANGFTIRELDLEAPDRYRASPNVHQLARDRGWWDPRDGPFDFTAAYASHNASVVRSLYIGRRMWRVLDLVAPRLGLDPRLGWRVWPTYPFAVTPDAPLALRDVRRLLRDHYEGTLVDMTEGIAAGPFGNPVRFNGNLGRGGAFERPLSMFRATFSSIAQVRPRGELLAGVLWFGQDAPHGTVYVPFYGAQDTLPMSFQTGLQSQFSFDSAWRVFNFVNNWIQLKYSYMIQDVRRHQAFWETRAEAALRRWDAEAGALLATPLVARAVIELRTGEWAQAVVEAHWRLAVRLISRYSSGRILRGERPGDLVQVGYPAAWLLHTDYPQWPGDTWAPVDGDAAYGQKKAHLAHNESLPLGP